MIRASLTVILLAMSTGAPASEGMPYLKLKQGGRATGLAGAAAAVPLGVDGLWYSPASVVGGKRVQIALSHQAWLGDSTVDTVAILGRVSWRHSLGLYGNFLAADDTKRDLAGNDIGPLSNNARVVGGAWNINWNSVAIGFGLKQFSQSFAGSALQGVAADTGLQFSLVDSRLRLGVAVQNLGLSSAVYGSSNTISTPLTLRAGFALDSLLIQGLLICVEARNDLFYNEMTTAAGAEYVFSLDSWRLALRSGWEGASSGAGDLAGWVLGGGVTIGDWVADFNWTPMGVLGDPYQVSLGWQFGGPPELEKKAFAEQQQLRQKRVVYRRPILGDANPERFGSEADMAEQACDDGDAAMREKRFTTARRYFQEAISYQPEFKRAWQGLGNACYSLDEKESALRAYKVALAADPGDQRLKDFISRLERDPSLPK